MKHLKKFKKEPWINIIQFTNMFKEKGFKTKNDYYNLRVLIKGDGDELDRTFDIEVQDINLNKNDYESYSDYVEMIKCYQLHETSVEGWNLNNKDSEWKEIFFSEIIHILDDLNK